MPKSHVLNLRMIVCDLFSSTFKQSVSDLIPNHVHALCYITQGDGAGKMCKETLSTEQENSRRI